MGSTGRVKPGVDKPAGPGVGESWTDDKGLGVRNPGRGIKLRDEEGCNNVRTFGSPSVPDRTQSQGSSPSREATLRQLGLGLSALGSIITVSYGRVKVPGVLLFIFIEYGILYSVWSFGFGEIESFNDIYINEEDISVMPSKVFSEERLGLPSQSVTTIYGHFSKDQRFPGLTLYGTKFDTTTANFGGSLDIVADINARKVYEFRTTEPGYGTWIYTDNLVLVAYDILTADWPWTSEIDPSTIDYDSWAEGADLADELISSGTGAATDGRYRYRGTFDNRDAWAAAEEVLHHAHMHVAAVGDKFYLWREGDVTPNSGLIENWFATPKCSESEPGTITTEINVLYWSFADNDERNVVASIAAGVNEYVQEEIAMNGFREGFEALRWGMQEIALRHETQLVTGVTGPEAAQLIPGMIQPMDLQNGYGTVNVRILKVPTEVEKGKYTINGRIVIGDVESDANIDGDGRSEWVPPWTSVVENLPSNVDQKFIYSGDWDEYNQIDDENDLTGSPWYGVYNPLVTYVPVGDDSPYSTIGLSGGTTGNWWFPGNWGAYSAIPDRALVVFLYRTNSSYTYDASLTIKFQVYSGTVAPPGNLRVDVDLTPENDTDHEWKIGAFIVDNVTTDTYFAAGFSMISSSEPVAILDVKKLNWVPWGSNPNLAILEKFSWTEHVDAADTIVSYGAWQETAAIEGSRTDWRVPVGNSELEFSVLAASGITRPLPAVGGQYYLRARGNNRQWQTIPIDTQSFENLGNFGDLRSVRDIDETNIATGTILVTAADGSTKEMQSVTQALLMNIEVVTGSSITLDEENHTVLCAYASGNTTVTLPAAASHTGRVYIITKSNSSAYNVIVDANGSELISGQLTITIIIQWDSMRIISDGTGWVIQ